MSRPATFSSQARAEVRQAAARIGRDNRKAALAFRDAIAALARLIGEHPLVGTERPKLAGPPYRFTVVRGFPYVVAYDATSPRPRIVRMVHGARDLPEVLKDL